MGRDPLINTGLERLIEGDLAGAAAAFLRRLEQTPDDTEVRQFLLGLHDLNPTLVDLRRILPQATFGATDAPWGEACFTKPTPVTSVGPCLPAIVGFETPPEVVVKPAQSLPAQERALKERLDLDDFTGALQIAEGILHGMPAHAGATAAKAHCTERLSAMYRSKIGDLQAVPQVIVRPDEVAWLDLDHRSGFVLSQVDGISTYAEILEISALWPLETLRILAHLVSKKVVGVQPSTRKGE